MEFCQSAKFAFPQIPHLSFASSLIQMTFSRLFYLLLVLGFVPLSLSWGRAELRWLTAIYDVMLLLIATVDWRRSSLPEGVRVRREIAERFRLNDATEVRVIVENETPRDLRIVVKDEYPAEMRLEGERMTARLRVAAHERIEAVLYRLTPVRRGRFAFGGIAVRHLSRWRLAWRTTMIEVAGTVKVYPNLRRAREVELRALGAQSLAASHRRVARRGEGREFESLREYVAGDELRHVSWTATARRGRLTTRQYQTERDQTILIALDAGRLMTARIENESKFDAAINAALALMSAAARGGDNSGLLIFGRNTKAFIPPGRGREHIEIVLESLCAIEPELVEPSYTRAFEFIASNLKRRALVVVLTDLVDEEGSSELLASFKLLAPAPPAACRDHRRPRFARRRARCAAHRKRTLHASRRRRDARATRGGNATHRERRRTCLRRNDRDARARSARNIFACEGTGKIVKKR
jgi:uncharacterized protein (DUF58 family)